jgi:NMD protein affecting ribosome stability and mRNA decay
VLGGSQAAVDIVALVPPVRCSRVGNILAPLPRGLAMERCACCSRRYRAPWTWRGTEGRVNRARLCLQNTDAPNR